MSPFGIEWLTLFSAGALAVSVLTYVLLDGTDLGVGMLTGLSRRDADREIMVRSILPIWDANETWLVLAGGGLLALFPLAYATLLPALYLPLLVMFMALILRALGLEFREHLKHKGLADGVLWAGSLLATLCQGLVLGTLVQGITPGAGWQWFSAFALYCALALMVGYLWLGTCWLYWRTEGRLQERSARRARWLGAFTVMMLAGLLVWTVTLDERYEQRLTQPLTVGLAGAVFVLLASGFHNAFTSRWHCLPLFYALGGVVVVFGLMAVALFPLIVPPAMTLKAAAASPSTQVFMLSGFAVMVPITLGYNTLGFRVFTGKVR